MVAPVSGLKLTAPPTARVRLGMLADPNVRTDPAPGVTLTCDGPDLRLSVPTVSVVTVELLPITLNVPPPRLRVTLSARRFWVAWLLEVMSRFSVDLPLSDTCVRLKRHSS